MNSRHPFAFRDFRLFWIARVCSMLSQTSLAIAIGWQVYDLARRSMDVKQAAFQLGLVGLLQFLPLFSLVLVAGWVTDRQDRRHLIAGSNALQLSCAALACWLSWSGAISIHALFAIAMLLGVGKAFSMPALNALAPNLVPREILPRAIATNAIAGRIGGILGPVLGGIAYARSPVFAYGISVALYLVALLAMLTIRPVARPARVEGESPLRQIREGLRFVRSQPIILGAISLDLVAVLLGGVTALLPVFARDILHTGPDGLGLLRAAPAIGGVTAALLLSWKPMQRGVGRRMLVAVAVFGAASLGFGLSHSMALSLGLLAVMGASDMVSVFIRQSLVQITTPDAMRGRVGSISTLFISASNELGEAESGFLAALAGPVFAVVAGGVGAIAAALIWAKLFPDLRRARSFSASPAS